MGFMDIFRRGKGDHPPLTETRSSGTGYTAQIIAARSAFLTGSAGLGELTAAVQSCVMLWEGGLALADVRGTDLLTRRSLAMTARSLALRGEAVFLIRDRLIPATDWDLTTADGVPRSYRLQIPEVGGPRSEIALAGEVLHFRIGSDAVTPWAGTAPLRRATLSAQLMAEIETALRDVFRDAPLGSQIVPMPEAKAADMEAMRTAITGARGKSIIVEGVAQAVGAGLHPQLGKSPDQLSPDLSRTLAGELLRDAKGSIFLAFGVLPGLQNAATTGPLVREAQRHLAQLILQPIAGLMAEEATEKLGGKITLDVVRPMQAFDHGGKARALATMVQALTQAKEAQIDGATLHDALTFIDWQEE